MCACRMLYDLCRLGSHPLSELDSNALQLAIPLGKPLPSVTSVVLSFTSACIAEARLTVSDFIVLAI